MSSNLTTNDDFQTRMFNRMREQIGELLTEEEMKKLLATAMQKAFFEERRDGYNNTKPSIFIELVRAELAEQLKQWVRNWVAENEDEVKKAVVEESAKMMRSLLFAMMKGFADSSTWTLINEMRNNPGAFR